MAINVVSITQVTDDLGFSRWTWLPLLPESALGTSAPIPYTEIPSSLLPADEFQVAAETSTCALVAPWGAFDDPFTEFLLGGGTSGTLIGALNGLEIVEASFEEPSTANYGLGLQYLGPEIGYCIGTLFKEKVYSRVDAENVNNLLFVGSSDEHLIFRSTFERFYVNHGLISAFSAIDTTLGTYTVTLDTNAQTTSVDTVDFSSINDIMTLYYRENGDSVSFSINEVRGITGGLEVDIQFTGEDIDINFGAGDFFVLSTSWLIQDPYLLDGTMNSIFNQTIPTGTQEFFRTDQNAAFSEGAVTGVYIRKRNIQVGDTVEVSGSTGTVIGVS